MKRGAKGVVGVACALLLCTGALRAAEDAGEGFGVPVFPGAESKPRVARAVEAYYRPGVSETQTLTAAVFETPAEFQKVYDFYGRRMESGKWGWRKKTRYLIQQTETLKFMRAELVAERGGTGRKVPEIYRPFFGDPNLSESEFNRKLERLRQDNKGAKIQVVEGTRTIPGDPAGSQVRITVERPFLDLEKMKLVNKARIVLVKVSKKEPSPAASKS